VATKPKAVAKRKASATSSAKSSVKSRAKAAPKRVAKAKVSRANDDIGEDTRLALWRSLLEIRHVEQRAYDLFLQNLVKGTSHLALGQEAVAAGFARCT
jgi:TPP-dependent pyruvate/acetoin dehydrogenase alpha subunit